MDRSRWENDIKWKMELKKWHWKMSDLRKYFQVASKAMIIYLQINFLLIWYDIMAQFGNQLIAGAVSC